MLNSINAVSNNNKQSFGMSLTTNAAKKAIEVAGSDLSLLRRAEEIAENAASNKNIHVDYDQKSGAFRLGEITDNKKFVNLITPRHYATTMYLNALDQAVKDAVTIESENIAGTTKRILDLSV